MKLLIIFKLCVLFTNLVIALTSEEAAEVTETCCNHGEMLALRMASTVECSAIEAPEDIEPDQMEFCVTTAKGCCELLFQQKDECAAGQKLAPNRRCAVPQTDIGKTCCEECSLGRWTGETQGKEACGTPADPDSSPNTALRKDAYYQCCLEAVEKLETTTEKIEATTKKKGEGEEKCKKDSCEHICNDDGGRVQCSCRDGFRMQANRRSCQDINECAEAIDDLCTKEGTVCHNTPGSYKCVPLRKREVAVTCPPGFKRNALNLCDDINECQLPRPPCPKYLCENTIGGYKCGNKAFKPTAEPTSGDSTNSSGATPTERNDICPPGFRAGPDDDCVDIDECEESLDDCQRLSQHCINTHGNFFCQDHVSKRCAPGFKINSATGICEDINECEESPEVCKRSEICVNQPGAYNCKSKISTLPKLAPSKTCQEGTRMRPGGTICEDIDECREVSHLCDQFQNCINTYGGHECRCKNGFELDPTTSSCIDIDECALKLDNCGAERHCMNILGSFTCTRRPPTSTTTTTTTTTSTTTLSPEYEYEYYDEDEDNTTIDETKPESSVPPTPATTSRSTYITPIPAYTTPRTTYTTTPKPPAVTTPRTTTSTTTTIKPKTTSTTTTFKPPITKPTPPTYSRPRPRPSYTYPSYPRNTTTERSRPVYIPPTTQRTRKPDGTRPGVYEVTVPTPDDPAVIEKEKDPEGGYEIDTNDIPKDKWTNVIGKESEEGFDINNLHCLNGYEKNEFGECVDINECEGQRHICSSLERCVNRPGGYVCECIAGFRRDATGWCVVSATTPTTTSTTTSRPITARTTTARPATARPTTTSTTERTNAVPRTPDWYTPARGRESSRPYSPNSCDAGYKYDYGYAKCIDVDECSTNKANCAPDEECVNFEGGYRCRCGKGCHPQPDSHSYEVFPETPRRPSGPSGTQSNVITVGAQYGQRGPRQMRPSYSRLPHSGAVVASCSWGYNITPDKRCIDIDECARNISQCGPQQRCENFYGGYSCQCPDGHRLVGQDGCEDVDECLYGHCPYNAECINTIGSYRCSCSSGFRNAPSNDKVCVDIDECVEQPGVCEQNCANAWGGYRCYCERGYRLHKDNRTCVDVDECEEWSTARSRGRLCAGQCVNVRGSYRCACPTGYRLSEDGRSCVDIDECETGEASCARSGDMGEVCQNTRGGYHCHRIDCPSGYKLESKHRCSRTQRMCQVSDWECLQRPSSYSYNFITFVSNIYLPSGSVDLFTMHGPLWSDSVVNFELNMINSKAQASGIRPADLSCFDKRASGNICVISLQCSLEGPQVAELELTMSLYQRGQFAGSAVARLVVIVSQYEF